MDRRQLVAAAAGLAVLPGCVDGGPDPEVEEVDSERDFIDVLGGTADFVVVIRNDGEEGDVRVEVVFEDDTGTVIDRVDETVYMEADERRQVTITAEVPEDADTFRATAEAANG